MDILQTNTRKKTAINSITCLLIFLFILPGCYNDKEEILYPGSNLAVDCTTIPSKFAANVNPIISSNCAIPGCHDASAAGGVILQTYTQINAKKDRINARAIVEKSMPGSGALSTAEINKLKCWIDGGALDN